MRVIGALLGLGIAVAAAADAAVSADIAYLRFTDHYWQVWITDPNGVQHRQVTFDSVDKSRASWSSDRRRLLYSSNDGTLAVVELATMAHVPIPLDSLGVYDAQWSPDGGKITYSATTSLQADNAEIWVSRIDGGERKKITDHIAVALTPTWNPRNSNVLFSAGRPGRNQELWEVDPATGQSTQRTMSRSSALDPSVSSDGTIAYSSDSSGNFDIWILDSTQKPQQLIQSTAFEAQPSWSPDGKRLVFYRLDGKQRRLWVLDLETRREVPITPADALSRYPAWSR